MRTKRVIVHACGCRILCTGANETRLLAFWREQGEDCTIVDAPTGTRSIRCDIHTPQPMVGG